MAAIVLLRVADQVAPRHPPRKQHMEESGIVANAKATVVFTMSHDAAIVTIGCVTGASSS